jgi:hypothetical protein
LVCRRDTEAPDQHLDPEFREIGGIARKNPKKRYQQGARNKRTKQRLASDEA